MTEFVLPDGVLPVRSVEGDLDHPFWEGTRSNEIRIQRCTACARFQWGPEVICHHCHSFELTFESVAPRGTVYSWQRSWRPVVPELAPAMPYVAVVVALEAHPQIRMIGNLVGAVADEPVRIGAPIEAVFEHHAEYTLVHWRYAETS